MNEPETISGGSFSRRRMLAGAAVCALPVLLLLGPRWTRADAVQRSPGALYAADFRAPGLGDRQVLQRAFEAWRARGGTLHLETDTIYDLGYQNEGDIVFDLNGLTDSTLAGNGATLMIETNRTYLYNLLFLTNYRNLRIENLRAVDTGFVGTHNSGANFIVVDAARTGAENLTLDNVVGDRLVSLLQVQGPDGAPRVRGIRIAPNCRASRVFYAFAFINQGDDVTGGYTAVNCGRSYFPYGVAGHDLVIRVHGEPAAFAPEAETSILVKSYGRPTSRLRLDLTFSGILRSPTCVALEHQPLPARGPSVIEDVDLRITIAPDVADRFGARRLVFRSFYPDNTQRTGRTDGIWRRIRLSGNLRPGAGPTIASQMLPQQPVEVRIAPGTIGADPGHIDAPGFRFVRL